VIFTFRHRTGVGQCFSAPRGAVRSSLSRQACSIGWQPILASQPLHPIELAKVAGNGNEAPTSCVAGNEHIIGANRATFSLECSAYIAGMRCRLIIEVKNGEAARKPFDFGAILYWPC
jgi:hypothetical protein